MDRDDFIEHLERNATRIDHAWKLQVPMISLKKGYVFFDDGDHILIRYNSEKGFFNFTSERYTSACFFSGKIETSESGSDLRGVYRFPAFMEFPKYIVLAFATYLILYFIYLVLSGSVTLIDSIVFALSLPVLGAAATWYGNVSAFTSIFARSTMKKVDALFAKYVEGRQP
ncbi:MAG: hypothetical protein OEN23_05510 [Paracoccaceae bacterium]|nr:hypothetical protein [Paracoccaceae bacterium]